MWPQYTYRTYIDKTNTSVWYDGFHLLPPYSLNWCPSDHSGLEAGQDMIRYHIYETFWCTSILVEQCS
jgi:hypothetical protein